MKVTRTLLLTAALSFLASAQAQNVGINTTGAAPAASAMLDIAATDRGLLIPRVALTATNAATPVTAPADALLVYNTATAGTAPNNVTPGYYHYDLAGTRWVPILSGVKGWSTTGNAGTVAGTNFLGTTDANDLVFKTGGSAAGNERFRVLAAGQVVVNHAAPFSGDVFSVYGTGTSGATASIGTYSVNGYTNDGVGVYGASLSTGITGLLTGVQGESVSDLGTGVFGVASGTLGIGVLGVASNTVSSNQPIGVYGSVGNGTGFGSRSENVDNSGTGSIHVGNNAAGVFLANGSGSANIGTGVGGFGYGTTTTGGIGIVGVGNNGSVVYTPARGGGVVGTGQQYGVIGFARSHNNTDYNNNNATNGANASAGGYFEVQNGGGTAQTWAYVGVREVAGAGGLRKIIGPGSVNTIVKDLHGQLVALSCPEAPENVFQDYGAGKLQGGFSHIAIDPILAKNIIVDESHPLRVFIQLEGECKGVYVTNKTSSGFDVAELSGGTSNAPFSYMIVANRADEMLPDGSIARYSMERFPPAPGPVVKEKQELRPIKLIGDRHPISRLDRPEK